MKTTASLAISAMLAISLLQAARADTPLPTLTCNPFSTTPGVIYPSHFGDVMNTSPATYKYWSAGTQFLSTPTDHTIGMLTPQSPSGYNAPPTVPALASGWLAQDGPRLVPLPSNTIVGWNGTDKPNMNPNVMYFFRYRFMMDPQADASRFSLMFGDLQADDALKGVYLNGKLVRTTAVPANPEEKLTDSRLFASGGAQFKPGENEMIFAVLNIGDITKPPLYVDAHGHQPSMVALHLAAPIGGQCAPQPTISTPVIPAGVLTATTPMAYSGSLTNWGHSTVAQIRTLNTATNTIYGPFYAPIDPVTGTYSLSNAPPFPVGDYIMVGELNVDTSPNGTDILFAQSDIGSFSVTGLTLNQATNVDSRTKPNFTGTVPSRGTATTVSVTATRANDPKTYGPYTATIQADGSYRVEPDLLPPGDYTVTATVVGAADLKATTSFKVTAPADVPVTESVTPVPSLGEWALLWLTALLGAFGYLGMRKTRVR